ncbi:MAG TPA: DinB family protein [Gemmatimonadaceae bacterium]
MQRYAFLVESYRTERLKTLSVWSLVPETQMEFRPEPRARTPHEHMVHQCVSEDTWMRTMLGIDTGLAPLPGRETRLDFLRHYADASARRLALLEQMPDEWFEASTTFFDAERSRAWVLTRRMTHSAHHRGQLTTYLRLFGVDLYSTYGPTADTGGLFQHHAPVIYRYPNVTALLEGEAAGGVFPPLPGPGEHSPTERPDASATSR